MAKKRVTETGEPNSVQSNGAVSSETLPPSDVNGSASDEAPTQSNGNGRRPLASWRFPVDRGTNLQVALWPNTITLASGEEIEVLSMTISRSYKDKNGEWVNARTQFSFRVHELPVLQHAIEKAYGFAMDQRQQDSPF